MILPSTLNYTGTVYSGASERFSEWLMVFLGAMGRLEIEVILWVHGFMLVFFSHWLLHQIKLMSLKVHLPWHLCTEKKKKPFERFLFFLRCLFKKKKISHWKYLGSFCRITVETIYWIFPVLLLKVYITSRLLCLWKFQFIWKQLVKFGSTRVVSSYVLISFI